MMNHESDEKDSISECYDRSVLLLKNNSQSQGVIACTRSKKAAGRRYVSIFGRDASICSLGMSVSDNLQ